MDVRTQATSRCSQRVKAGSLRGCRDTLNSSADLSARMCYSDNNIIGGFFLAGAESPESGVSKEAIKCSTSNSLRHILIFVNIVVRDQIVSLLWMLNWETRLILQVPSMVQGPLSHGYMILHMAAHGRLSVQKIAVVAKLIKLVCLTATPACAQTTGSQNKFYGPFKRTLNGSKCCTDYFDPNKE